MRIFIAVELDAALRESVAALRSRVNSAAASLRWLPPANLHLTLKFLGQITETRTATVVAAAREVARRARPFSITLAGMGAFPSSRRPRVVWVGVVEGSDRLVALAGDLDTALRRMRFPKEARPFQPHLTVARAKDAGPAPDLSDTLRDLGEVRVGTQTVDRLFVMQSMLNPAGAIYHPVEEVGLGEAC